MHGRVLITIELVVTLCAANCWRLNAAESCEPIRTFADGRLPAREIFVSTTGNNTTGTGLPNNPYRTLSRAIQGVQAGDAIRLQPGTYSGGTFLQNVVGTSNAPIWLGGVPGQARPVISGGSQALHLSRARYLVVENLEITGATANGLNCDDAGDYANIDAARYLMFRNLYFHDIGTGGNNDGLKLSGVNDYQVLDCTFERLSAGGSGIDHVGCHRGLIARCNFTNAGSNAIQCKGGSEDIEIRANRIVNGGGRAINIGGSTGFEFFRPPLSRTVPNVEARNIRVLANVFQGSDAPVAFVGTVDSVVANNTIIEPVRWIIRILQETVSGGGYIFLPSSSNRFINNLVYYDRSRISTFVNVGGGTDPASFRFSNNLWYAFNQPASSRPSLPVAETGGRYGVNPLFRNSSAGDFSVPTNSPAAGAGIPVAVLKADQREQCYAAPPTIGAIEARPPSARSVDTDGDRMPDVWEKQNGFNELDPADALLDADDDRWSNLGEYLAGTDPRDPGSFFHLREPRIVNGGFSFLYSMAADRVYRVQSRILSVASDWSVQSVANGTGGEIEYRHGTLSHEVEVFRVQLELAE